MENDILPLDYRKIDPLIHSRIRLALMAILTRSEDVSFNSLKKALNATDGNLSTHLSKLEAAGYISVEKKVTEGKPESRYRVTDTGLSSFARYIMDLEPYIG